MFAKNRACDALTVCAARIAAAYVGGNRIAAKDVPLLIAAVHRALRDSSSLGRADASRIQGDLGRIICLEDGLRFKSLKRHLRLCHNMTPEQYREKWRLPPDYSFVTPEYRELRRAIAISTSRMRPVPIPAPRSLGFNAAH